MTISSPFLVTFSTNRVWALTTATPTRKNKPSNSLCFILMLLIKNCWKEGQSKQIPAGSHCHLSFFKQTKRSKTRLIALFCNKINENEYYPDKSRDRLQDLWGRI